MDVFVSDLFSDETRWNFDFVKLLGVSQTNTCEDEVSIKNWLPLATRSNMEDEMILILLLLKKRLQNLIFLMNYLIFIASR